MNKNKANKQPEKKKAITHSARKNRNPLELSLRMITILEVLDFNCLKGIGNSLASHLQNIYEELPL